MDKNAKSKVTKKTSIKVSTRASSVTKEVHQEAPEKKEIDRARNKKEIVLCIFLVAFILWELWTIFSQHVWFVDPQSFM